MTLNEKIVECIKSKVSQTPYLQCAVTKTRKEVVNLSDSSVVERNSTSYVGITLESKYTESKAEGRISTDVVPIFDARDLIANGISVVDLIDIAKLISKLLSEQVLLLIDNDYSLQVK